MISQHIFHHILSKSFIGSLKMTCAVDKPCHKKKPSDGMSALALISALWIVINKPEITTVARKNVSFLLFVRWGWHMLDKPCLSVVWRKKNALPVWRVACVFHFISSAVFCSVGWVAGQEMTVSSCQPQHQWVSFRAPVSSLSETAASTPQSLSSQTSH